MECNCKVTNNSGQLITKMTLLHAPGTLAPGSFTQVLAMQNFPSNTTSFVGAAPQETWEDDWYAMGVNFEGDTTDYMLSNIIIPSKECDTPANGSAWLVIGAQEVGPAGTLQYPVTINTYYGGDFANTDSPCTGFLVSPLSFTNLPEIFEALIDLIEELLGAE